MPRQRGKAMTATKEIDVFQTKLLWWDLTNLTESKVNSWMQTAFACKTKECSGKLRPPHAIDYTCQKCGRVRNITATQIATETLHCLEPKCAEPIDVSSPQIAAFLEEELVCNKCGATKESYSTQDDENWKVKHFVTALKLYHTASAWRNRHFNYNLNNLVFYDQRSVRVVPVEHSRDVEIVLEQAKLDLVQNVLPLDTLGVFDKWSIPAADIDSLWDEAIKFPRFTASDQQAQRAVLDTVKNSILGFVREANEKVLEKLNQNGKVHPKTVSALLRRLEELKKRDVWNVHMEPEVQVEMDALEGILQAEMEDEEE
jgi:hypothetical protein